MNRERRNYQRILNDLVDRNTTHMRYIERLVLQGIALTTLLFGKYDHLFSPSGLRTCFRHGQLNEEVLWHRTEKNDEK